MQLLFKEMYIQGIKNFIWRISVVIICFVVLLIAPVASNAQQINATATVDTNAIVIGNQFLLNLTITHPKNVTPDWPAVPDTFSLLEVVQRSPIDTVVSSDANTITRRQKIIITSFDTGYHVIPPFVFNYKLKGDTSLLSAATKAMLITVNTVPVDTTRAIKDLKGQIAIPFSWMDVLPYLIGVLVLALIIFLVYRYFKNRKSTVKVPEIVIPKRPAHEIALEALKELDEAKQWQNGNYKGYHTQISDILRTFIQNRWGLPAMEMTTDEILQIRLIANQNREVLEKLKYTLELSDLVKFAKTIPVVYENEQSLKNSFDFVHENKQLQEVKEVKEGEA